MTNLQNLAVLDQQVRRYKSDYSLDQLGDAFSWAALESILNLTIDEINDAIVDDGMDGGIDAIYILDTDAHIFNFNYATTFENTSKSFPQNKLDNLVVTIEKIMGKGLTEKDVNPALWDKVREIWDLLGQGPLNLHFYVCSNKNKPDESAIRRFQGNLSKFPFVHFNYLDLEDLVTKILQ